MKPIEITPFALAQRFIGTKEVGGAVNNPLIMAMLQLDATWPANDEVAWCSAFVNWIMWILRQPRSKALNARSWLLVGEAINDGYAEVGCDIVVLKRGGPDQPGPEVIDAQGHVGFFAGFDGS